jgi:hypothetical protein
VLAAFAKFQQGQGRDYRTSFPARVEINHVEAAVVNMVARHRAG